MGIFKRNAVSPARVLTVGKEAFRDSEELVPGRNHQFLKRCLDLGVSVILIVLLYPFFIIVSILIKLDSPGPVFYKQIRIGHDRRRGRRRRRKVPIEGERREVERGKQESLGVPFQMYKFRSMVVDAEKMLPDLSRYNEATGPLFKIKNDPRVTLVGKFLRKYSLDELPQLFNVLKGEMSLVGPRPGLPEEIAQYEPWQKNRLKVKQGITGLWQISGHSDVNFDKMIDLDLRYIQEGSVLLDIKVLLKTLPAVLRGGRAY